MCTDENDPSKLYHREISNYSANKIDTDQPDNGYGANLNRACARASPRAYTYPFKTCKT